MQTKMQYGEMNMDILDTHASELGLDDNDAESLMRRHTASTEDGEGFSYNTLEAGIMKDFQMNLERFKFWFCCI